MYVRIYVTYIIVELISIKPTQSVEAMNLLKCITLLILPLFICEDFFVTARTRAILDDFEWLTEGAIAEKKGLPVSDKVIEAPPSFFHLESDGDLTDLSETLEVELDHAVNRKFDLNLKENHDAVKSKREAVPNQFMPDKEIEIEEIFLEPKKSRQMAVPEASAVKQKKTNICSTKMLEKRNKILNEDEIGKPIPMRVMGDHKKRKRTHSFIPKKISKN